MKKYNIDLKLNYNADIMRNISNECTRVLSSGLFEAITLIFAAKMKLLNAV